MHPDEMPVSPVTTIYYTAPLAILPSSSPDSLRPGPRVSELSGMSKEPSCEYHTDE